MEIFVRHSTSIFQLKSLKYGSVRPNTPVGRSRRVIFVSPDTSTMVPSSVSCGSCRLWYEVSQHFRGGSASLVETVSVSSSLFLLLHQALFQGQLRVKTQMTRKRKEHGYECNIPLDHDETALNDMCKDCGQSVFAY